jgi:long-subunit fatty acid transport protein
MMAVMLILVQTITAQGQIVKRGQAGFRFLENPISAEAVGRGGLGVALMTNSNAVFWNPAGLGWLSNLDVSFNYTMGIADINHSSAAVGLPIGNFGVLAVSGIFMDYGEFYGTRRADNDEGYIETGTFSPSALALGLAFSQKVTDRFSFGVHLKYAYQDLGSAWVSSGEAGLGDPDFSLEQRNYSMGLPALDVGAYYDFLVWGIRFGAVVQNISREVEFEVEKFPLPFAISFGATIEPLLILNNARTASRLIFSVESRHPRDFRENVKFGAEYVFEDFLVLRTGYMDGYDERGLTAGAGVMHELGGVGVRMNYAYEAFGLFGGVHYLSIGLSY